MATLKNFAIPKGDTVLVTGANGFISSHVVDQFLEHGYRVRGTVRDVTKNAWLTTLFDGKHGKDRFELVSVPDMGDEAALAEAATGVSAVVHTTTIMTLDTDPNKVIPASIAGAVTALKAAYSEPSVRRFVLTSSSSAAYAPENSGGGLTITKDTWNEEAVEKAWAPQEAGEWGLQFVYPASKTQSEQAVWKFYQENKHRRPDLVVNTILPSNTMGPSVDPVNQGHPSSSMLSVCLFAGLIVPHFKFFPPNYYVDVRDVARLHVLGAIHPEVQGDRIFAFAARSNWNDVLAILRKNYPDREFPDNFSDGEDKHEIAERPRSERLLRDLGRPGWTSLEDCILGNVEGLDTVPKEELVKRIQQLLAEKAAI